MVKGILKSSESTDFTSSREGVGFGNGGSGGGSDLDSLAPKHVKWDEEKLRVSEAEKMVYAKGQFSNEPKTPFHSGNDFDVAINRDEVDFKLDTDSVPDAEEFSKGEGGDCAESDYSSSANSSSGWESSGDEEMSAVAHDRFKCLRAQHYFMKNSMEHGKELLMSESEAECEEIGGEEIEAEHKEQEMATELK